MSSSLRRKFIMCSIYVRILKPHPSAPSPLLDDITECHFGGPLMKSCVRFPINCIFQLQISQPRICTAMASLTKLRYSKYHLYHRSCVPKTYSPFTYSSKSMKDVGAAAVFPDSTLSHTPAESASIFTEEFYAILLGLSQSFVLNLDPSYLIILLRLPETIRSD